MKCDSWSLQQQLGKSDQPIQSKREVLVKEKKTNSFYVWQCICWNFIHNELSNLTKNCYIAIILPSEFSNVFFKDNLAKFPYDHCFHICNLYLMETGTQCFKEEDFMLHLFICQMSNGERAVAKCLQKLSWHPPCPLKSGRCCIMSCSLSSSWTLGYYLNNCRSARWKRGSRFG